MPQWISSESELAAYYGTPKRPSTAKVSRVITKEYRAYLETAPFCAFASVGPEGIDCSPRGDDGPVVVVVDETTLAMPDRRGNNRIDTLRNIVRDERVSLMFLTPGSQTIIRVNGKARITADADVCAAYEKAGQPPRSVVFVAVDEVYFQCARAVMRAKLWDGATAAADTLPTAGTILEAMTAREIDAERYDADWSGRAAKTMW